jgi:hypothetical protein
MVPRFFSLRFFRSGRELSANPLVRQLNGGENALALREKENRAAREGRTGT